ncbi:MAG: rhodanese-like domain-containing protein [Betaproteobacteria bacterium]|nr:rhodanese-like domain-containing protein [Betaproteobacteria bacterium]
MSESSEQCLAAAAARGAEADLPYAGALTPPEAHAVLRADTRAALVDVRTAPELLYVGRVHESVHVEWQIFPDMAVNPNFCEMLAAHADKTRPLLFMCRSGVRSHHAAAAAAAAGYRAAYNVLEGFEGDLDGNGRRGRVNGWRFHGLPWVQS